MSTFFDKKPDPNSRGALAAVRNRQALDTPAPIDAHQSKVPSLISRNICSPSEAPLTMKQRPENFENYKFVGMTIEKLNVLRMLPGHKEPSMVKLPFLVAQMTLNNHGPGEDAAKSTMGCTATQADLVKYQYPGAGRIAERLHDCYENKIAKYGQPPTPIVPRHAASNAPAQHARVAKAAPQHQQKPSLLAQLSKKFSFSA